MIGSHCCIQHLSSNHPLKCTSQNGQLHLDSTPPTPPSPPNFPCWRTKVQWHPVAAVIPHCTAWPWLSQLLRFEHRYQTQGGRNNMSNATDATVYLFPAFSFFFFNCRCWMKGYLQSERHWKAVLVHWPSISCSWFCEKYLGAFENSTTEKQWNVLKCKYPYTHVHM